MFVITLIIKDALVNMTHSGHRSCISTKIEIEKISDNNGTDLRDFLYPNCVLHKYAFLENNSVKIKARLCGRHVNDAKIIIKLFVLCSAFGFYSNFKIGLH